MIQVFRSLIYSLNFFIILSFGFVIVSFCFVCLFVSSFCFVLLSVPLGSKPEIRCLMVMGSEQESFDLIKHNLFTVEFIWLS